MSQITARPRNLMGEHTLVCDTKHSADYRHLLQLSQQEGCSISDRDEQRIIVIVPPEIHAKYLA